LLSALTGGIAGYVNSRLYKFFNGVEWMINVVFVIFLVPMIIQQSIAMVTLMDNL
jgi:hypothetical protein